MSSQRCVLVVGSINTDVVVRVHEIPKPGQTVHGAEPAFLPGGKGGNQAVSAVTSGATTFMVGAVGDDAFGSSAIDSLKNYGVNTDNVLMKPGSTGTAYIYVDDAGENSIVVVAGANEKVEPTVVADSIASKADSAAVVLCQMELPMEVVESAAQIAAKIGTRFVLNLAPALAISDELLATCDPIILNETEAAFLTKSAIASIADAEAAVLKLAEQAKSVVITLGAMGAVFGSREAVKHLPSDSVSVVDTTGAGDAFVGALAAAFAAEADLESAVTAGLGAGARTVQHFGAQPPLTR